MQLLHSAEGSGDVPITDLKAQPPTGAAPSALDAQSSTPQPRASPSGPDGRPTVAWRVPGPCNTLVPATESEGVQSADSLTHAHGNSERGQGRGASRVWTPARPPHLPGCGEAGPTFRAARTNEGAQPRCPAPTSPRPLPATMTVPGGRGSPNCRPPGTHASLEDTAPPPPPPRHLNRPNHPDFGSVSAPGKRPRRWRCCPQD